MNSYDAMIFSGETPMMSGTWYNPQTGDSFTVADAFFQDNQYLVKTVDGRILDYNIIQNYIKSDKPIPTQKKSVNEQLPKEVSNILLISSYFMLSKYFILNTTRCLGGRLANAFCRQIAASSPSNHGSLSSMDTGGELGVSMGMVSCLWLRKVRLSLMAILKSHVDIWLSALKSSIWVHALMNVS